MVQPRTLTRGYLIHPLQGEGAVELGKNGFQARLQAEPDCSWEWGTVKFSPTTMRNTSSWGKGQDSWAVLRKQLTLENTDLWGTQYTERYHFLQHYLAVLVKSRENGWLMDPRFGFCWNVAEDKMGWGETGLKNSILEPRLNGGWAASQGKGVSKESKGRGNGDQTFA